MEISKFKCNLIFSIKRKFKSDTTDFQELKEFKLMFKQKKMDMDTFNRFGNNEVI